MALTLSKGARSALTLDPNSTVAADSLAGDITDTTEFGKGWASAGLGSQANSLWTQAAKAGAAGREADRQALEMQARDIQQQTGQWAPRVSQVTDVRSLRDAADWASGAMGNLRTSVAPAVAGLAGGVAGALAAPVTGGVVNPVNAGFAAAAAAGYDMETDEAVAQAMNDPYIRSNHSYADILAASRVKGGINALLESAVPTVMGGKVLGTMGKGAVGRFFGKAATKAELAAAQAAERAGQQAIVNGGVMGAAKTVGKNVLEGGAGEFATEGTQNLVGQGAQNYLKGKDLTDFDYQSALNDAAAGGIAGAGMGVMGGAGEVGHAYAGAGKEAVNEIKQDPVGKAADFIADAGTKAGTGAAKAVDTLSKLVSSDYRAHDVLVNDRGGPEQQQAAAMQWAKAKLEDSTTSESERADAASFVEGLARGDENAWQDYKNKLTVNHFENQHVQGDSAIADEIATRLGEKSKASQMRASTRMYIESGALAPDKSPKLLETTADIWRKQGVDEKLLTATSDKTDSAQRQMAIGLLGWVSRGFKDVDGNVFIPESLVKRYGDKTGKMIQSAAKTAFQQGLIGHDVAKQVPEIMQQATLQHAEVTTVHDAILNAIPELVRDTYSRQDIADLDEVLRHVAKHGTNKVQEEALLKVFGSKENIAHAMSKLPEEKSGYGNKVDTHSGEDYDSGLTVSEGGERVKYHGYNRTDKPFNLLHEGQAKAHATRMSTHQNDGAVYARSIGAHDAVLEQYGQEHEYLRKAEDDMMWRAVKKTDSTEADREAYMQHLDSLSTDERRSQLKALNKSHKFIRVEQVTGDEIADKIRPDQVNSFRETRKPGSPHVTAAGGMIYLERKAQVDKDTGEAVGKDEDFLTSTHRLIQHAWGAEGKESDGRTLGDKGKGAKGVYESFLRGMAALVESDGSFTGRVGFKATPTSEIKWVTRNNLPRDLKLGSYTAADAKRQIIAERNDNRTYEGDGELVGDVIEEKPSDSDNIVPSEHREEKPIYRNSDGSRQGLADDAIGAGYEGHAQRSDKAAEPVTAPLATVKNPEKSLAPTKSQIDALDKLESAKNWAVEKLRAGMPTFNKAVAGFTKDRVETLVNALKTFTALGPEGVKKQFGKTLSDSQASALLTRATIALRQLEGKIEALSDEGVVNDTEERSKLGEGERGQAAVERKSDGETGSAQVDKVGKPAVSNVGQTERTGSLGLGGILSVKQLDDAIYKEDFGKFDTVDKLQQLAEHTYQRSVELEQRDELTEREEGVGAIAGQLVFDAQAYLKNPDRSGTDFESFFEGVKHTEADVENFIKALAGKKQSTQTADLGTGKRATKAEQTAAKQHILDTIGDTVKGAFVKHFGDNSSGSWTPGEHENTIRIALNSDVLSTSYHESMHEFFDMLKKHGNEATVKLLERVASNEVLNRKIELLLEKHPEAAAQVRESPEEAAVFMYQFWQAGQLKLGQEVGGFFNKIKRFFATILGRVSKEVRDEKQADAILQAFSRGDFKSVKGDTAVREASMAALKANTAQHDKVLDNLDKVGRDFTRVAGRVLFSAEAMLKGTKNKHMADVARMYNQEAGEAKGKEQSLFEGIKQQDGIWMNKLDNLLNAYKKEDLELAREALSKGVPAKDRIAKEIVGKIESFYKEIFDRYITPRDIRRLDEDGHWVKVTPRQNYFTRVWDTNAIQKNPVEFRDRLIQHHMKELVATAALANKEMADYNNGVGNYANLGPAARKEVEKAMNAFNESGKIMGKLNTQTITPEMVADAIVHRLLNSKGHVDLAESTSSLGITPVATSINRRSLSWINDELFDEFKSKDIANIMTSYVTSMVKRGEYTRVFGHGNQKLNDRIDSAVLSELGGEPLVKKAKDVLPLAIQQWKKAKAKALKDKVDFDEPFPTLRAVGQRIHSTQVGQEKALADLKVALKSLDQGFKAIMAMDGTLGAHISQSHRALNSMMMTYQTLRLLPLVTFSSVNDVMGIVANGGELHDAWDALVAGMREIRLRWSDQKTNDKRAMRAESWGTVDAGSFLDNLGQTYGSMYMSDKARKFSNAFFKWNGMEGWNRAMRITATAVAERAIKAYKTEGFDKTDKAAVARFEALFGKGFKAEDIAVDENGDLDLNDLQNQAAVMHWVSSAIMSPNASHRTIWGSDLRMAPFWMLKQFAYTFHRVMLKGAIEQAKLGNFRPAMVLVAGYAPITIAADAVKEMLIPGDEPPWMKGGLDGYLAHAYDRSGIFGVPGMSYDALTSYDGPVIGALDAIGGPSVSQATNAMFDSVGKTALSAAPFGSLLRRAAD